MKIKILLTFFIVLAVGFNAVSARADAYCRKCPFDCSTLDLGKKDCSFVSNASGVCCVDLTKKGLNLAQAQEKVLAAQPNPAQDHCPSGFRPSENKCTSEERRHGCKDMRLPSGLGCVKRR